MLLLLQGGGAVLMLWLKLPPGHSEAPPHVGVVDVSSMIEALRQAAEMSPGPAPRP
jgi:hypothetical protein